MSIRNSDHKIIKELNNCEIRKFIEALNINEEQYVYEKNTKQINSGTIALLSKSGRYATWPIYDLDFYRHGNLIYKVGIIVDEQHQLKNDCEVIVRYPMCDEILTNSNKDYLLCILKDIGFESNK